MSRVLICGEGPNDIGRREWVKRSGAFEVREGWLQPMVARLRTSEGDATAISLKELITFPGRGIRVLDGLARKAQIAKFRAGSDGFTGVVLATDVDSTDRRVHAQKEAHILEGYATVENDVVGVACVPMGTSEAWLMADRAAWERLGADEFDEWPRRPEESWGRPHEPSSNHPKNVFARMCRDNDIVDNSETRAELAAASTRGELARRAPVSFPPFAQQAAEL
jgi:hypothetical protein